MNNQYNDFMNQINKEISFYDMKEIEIDNQLLELNNELLEIENNNQDEIIYFQYWIIILYRLIDLIIDQFIIILWL